MSPMLSENLRLNSSKVPPVSSAIAGCLSNASLPIDEGTVAVEGDGVEGAYALIQNLLFEVADDSFSLS